MPKITFSHNFLWVNFRTNFTFLLGLCLSIFIFNFNSASVFALYVPTLSASINQANAQINGNQVINSTDKTTEIPLNLTVNTNNKTGYTAILNSETNETALVNNDSTNGAKINSISSAELLGDFSDNTWGVKVGASTNFLPIPKLTSPMNAIQTAGKTNGSETNSIKIGMKLASTLDSGFYTNKLVFSIVTNNYEKLSIMSNSADVHYKLRTLISDFSRIEYFKKSLVPPAYSNGVINIEDEDSDNEIELWWDSSNNTVYYYIKTEKVYLNKDSSSMFSGMSNLRSLDLSSFDTSMVTNMAEMFTNMSSVTSLDLSNFDTSKVVKMNNMFANTSNITSLNISGFNTVNVTDMRGMFSGMSNLRSLDISSFNTSNVMRMDNMFSRMNNLASINLSNFDTSKVVDMGSMFGGLSSIVSLDISNFNTSKVTDMRGMFAGVSNITSLNLSNFDTAQVKNMSNMFAGMSSITSLDLSNFDTSKVANMDSMFSNMTNLTSLDLSNFDTSQVTNMWSIFSLNNSVNDKLEKIYVNNDFNTTKLVYSSEMFKNRKKLRGGNGSFLANPSTADKTWLRVDRPGVQGYFTRKP